MMKTILNILSRTLRKLCALVESWHRILFWWKKHSIGVDTSWGMKPPRACPGDCNATMNLSRKELLMIHVGHIPIPSLTLSMDLISMVELILFLVLVQDVRRFVQDRLQETWRNNWYLLANPRWTVIFIQYPLSVPQSNESRWWWLGETCGFGKSRIWAV